MYNCICIIMITLPSFQHIQHLLTTFSSYFDKDVCKCMYKCIFMYIFTYKMLVIVCISLFSCTFPQGKRSLLATARTLISQLHTIHIHMLHIYIYIYIYIYIVCVCVCVCVSVYNIYVHISFHSFALKRSPSA